MRRLEWKPHTSAWDVLRLVRVVPHDGPAGGEVDIKPIKIDARSKASGTSSTKLSGKRGLNWAAAIADSSDESDEASGDPSGEAREDEFGEEEGEGLVGDDEDNYAFDADAVVGIDRVWPGAGDMVVEALGEVLRDGDKNADVETKAILEEDDAPHIEEEAEQALGPDQPDETNLVEKLGLAHRGVVEALEAEQNLGLRFSEYNKSYLCINKEAAGGSRNLGKIHTMGSGSIHTSCNLHGASCRIFLDPKGRWEECFVDCVSWLCQTKGDTPVDKATHLQAVVAIKRKYATRK